MENTELTNEPVDPINTNQPTVLVVEDDVGLNHLIRKTLVREGFKTHPALNGAEAIAAAMALHDTVILLDYFLPDINGMQVITALREKKIEAPIIMMTGNGDQKIAIEIMKMGVRDYVVKEQGFVDTLPKIIRQTFDAIAKEKALAKAERALTESEQRYRLLFDDARDGKALADVETGTLVDCNHALCDMVEHTKEELVGQMQSILHPPQNLNSGKSTTFIKHNASDSGKILEDQLISKSGKLIPVEIRASHVHINGHDYLLGVFRDISERKRNEKEKQHLQAQLFHAQKLEAVGTLAGGVAHDFNNLLTAIIGYTHLAIMKVEESDPILQDLKQVTIAGSKASAVVRQLLLFSRKQPMELTPVNFNKTINNLLKMVDRLIGENIAIETKLDPDLWTIQADEGTLEQVIMNLMVNARDAMPEGGTIIISTGNVHIDEKYCIDKSYARPGPFASLWVTDTGTGMDAATMEHIFEPFYTTKEKGKGTGLGLSVVYGIVKQHDGWVVVESTAGQGTTFKIYLPSSFVKIDHKTTEKVTIEKYTGKGERILVVEDQSEVCEMVIDLLVGNGYTVFSAENAKKARALFAQEKGDFDLVFSDVMLPDMSGIKLVEELSSGGRKFRVLFSSGYADDKAGFGVIKERGYGFLQKPYPVQTLLMTIREILDTVIR